MARGVDKTGVARDGLLAETGLVRAARYLQPGEATPDARELHAFVVGASLVLWSFGTWWIPLLVLFGLWRHVLRR